MNNIVEKEICKLFDVFTLDHKIYCDFARDYYEKDIDEYIVKKIFDHKDINTIEIQKLNDEITVEDISEDLIEIDY